MPQDVAEHLLSGAWQAYSYGQIMVAVEKQEQRLCVRSLAGAEYVAVARGLAAALDRLAAEWSCDIVETTCFDQRMAKAMLRLGAQVESWTLVRRVED